jgi:hypothetical protein
MDAVNASSQPLPLVLVGRVGAGAETTWDPGKAAFVVTDSAAAAEAHHQAAGHSHDNCPFCQAKAKKQPAPIALVKLVDSDGQVVPIDARKLLAIKERQLVVVRGVGQIDSVGNLVVAADGIFTRR